MRADAYARLTGKLGVAIVTAGPGVTDALTGVANAYFANSPMLLLGGRHLDEGESQGRTSGDGSSEVVPIHHSLVRHRLRRWPVP